MLVAIWRRRGGKAPGTRRQALELQINNSWHTFKCSCPTGVKRHICWCSRIKVMCSNVSTPPHPLSLSLSLSLCVCACGAAASSIRQHLERVVSQVRLVIACKENWHKAHLFCIYIYLDIYIYIHLAPSLCLSLSFTFMLSISPCLLQMQTSIILSSKIARQTL